MTANGWPSRPRLPSLLAILAASALASLCAPPAGPAGDLLPGVAVRKATRVGLDVLGGSKPTFTPSGDLAVYRHPLFGMGAGDELRVVEVATGRVLKQSLAPDFKSPTRPRLSPDGKALIFVGVPREQAELAETGLYRTDLNGSPPVRLTPTEFHAGGQAWSPDGQTLAFTKGVGEARRLRFLSPVRPGGRFWAPDVDLALGDLQYSPDGRWLGCQADAIGLGVIDLSAAKMRFQKLFASDQITLSFPRGANTGIGTYVWLPDSQRLLVRVGSDRRGDRYRICLVNLKGEAREIAKARLVGNTINGRILFIEQDDVCWRLDLE